MMSNFVLSIITINLNNFEGLKKTIYSVLNQISNDVEFIVVDGYSIDGSIEFLRENSNYINKLVIERDEGIYYAMNKGASFSNANFLLFLNSGDELYENSLVRILKIIKSTNADILYGKIYIKDNELNHLKYKLIDPNLRNLEKYMSVFHPSTLISYNVFFKLGLYNTKFKLAADYYFILKAFKNNYKFYYLDFPVSIFEGGGFSSKNAFLSFSENIKIKFKFWPFYISIPSIILMIIKFYSSIFFVKIGKLILSKSLYYKLASILRH
jgi:glycosyltransferase involved in cell wall biosynthesis